MLNQPIKVMSMKTVKDFNIPEMTHHLSKAWDQPDRSEIKFVFGVAWMSQKAFNKLRNYSDSRPSAVYEGKMWRREYIDNGKTKHLLCWFGLSDKPEHCSINQVELIIE